MQKVLFGVAVAACLASSLLSADVKVGLGFGIDTMNSLKQLFMTGGDMMASSIRIPVDIGKSWRVEPDIVLGQYYSENDSGADGIHKNTETTYGVGAGLYYTLWNNEKVNFYTGGHLGAIHYNDKDEYTKNSSINDEERYTMVSLQGLFGAEYYFVDEMSLAAQVGLDFSNRNGTMDESDLNSKSIGTTTSLVIRYFF